MQGELIRKKLHLGEYLYGTHVCGLSNTTAMQIMAMAPLDFAFICTEHMPLDRSQVALLCQMYSAWGISPAVRIPSPCTDHASMALDAGAQGIVAPYVETAEQARRIASTVHFRPVKGRMLQEFASGQREPSAKTKAFLERFNRHSYAIMGIESMPGYENLDAIIAQPGVDGVFIGYHDLSCSMELPEEWDNPKCWEVIEDIVVRCRAANIGVGLHLHPRLHKVERVHQLIASGMNWVLDGADAVFAMDALETRRLQLLGSLKAVPSDEQGTEVASCIAP